MSVGQDFDPRYPVQGGRYCLDVRAQRRAGDGFRAAVYLPSRVGQVRVAVDIPPGLLRNICDRYHQLLQMGDEAQVSGLEAEEFLGYLPATDEGPAFVAGLEELLGPAMGLLGPLLGGGGGGGGLGALLGPLLGGGGGAGGLAGLFGGGGGGGAQQLLQMLASGGLGTGAQLRQQMGLGSPFDSPMGGVMGGLGKLGGGTPSAPGLGGLLGGILGGIPILGPLLGPLFGGGGGGLGGLFQQAMQPPKDPGVIPAQVTVQVPAATPQGAGGSPGVVQPNRMPWNVSGWDEDCGDLIPPLEGVALLLGETLGDRAMSALPFLAASHVISDALREVHLNPHRFGPLAPELSANLQNWLAASDNCAAAACGHPEATENLYKAQHTPAGSSAIKVVRGMVKAPFA